jgi:uncharacterized membrane protein YcaP (DUF421 family)
MTVLGSICFHDIYENYQRTLYSIFSLIVIGILFMVTARLE